MSKQSKKTKVQSPVKSSSSNRAFTIVVVGLVVAIVAVLVITKTTSSSEKRTRERHSEAIDKQTKKVGSSDTDGNYKKVVQEIGTKATFAGKELPEYSSNGTDAAVGNPAPVITAETFAGKPVEVNPVGKPYMISFLAHWCVHCNAEAPIIVDLQSNGKFPKGLKIIAISTGVKENQSNYPPSTWFATLSWPFPVFLDDPSGNAIKAMGGSGYPHIVFIDVNGNVVRRLSGEQPAEELISAANATVAVQAKK